ncbi:diaminohydroxyphosphoribosylaminopyrimidine deaminase [Pseudoxanthomonas sp. GM95]|uniref:bifunctional diaminohydroxyphosphoribosylaminopyrimidine deaminase/5-amino-6-(5-phosphoribosylamino)uracil reductase RibD n=1 Tax=Pseudoxanthomonas sp. GM95 TaxID=1881043 RepID=UPI0008D742B1|nr:bifunctional diaminohydroxyphosphoribosylaminopyrimidine deaminase/5-amino-6-(5-phosphoribosylamino)uracil reductase RibD [Pseudoxanthomonas sp. GM95]SEK46330.1 diaminohydroxyphosphoribosylaminopyrimidine deaminase [Pseudoxanthomonas sp. GM95]
MSEFSATDHVHMARALRLAERGAWTAKPNPMVGCVIAYGDAVVGEGFHQYAGQPHAEVFALRQAGERARGATAYVTLEPCAHTGRTGPCAEALVAAGVSRVVAAMRDPFPQVDGAGFEKLHAAGIAVQVGLLEAQVRELNRGFISHVVRGRPWVRVKLGASLDARTAMASGESKWITGASARADVQRWRARAGAIVTGARTVIADDPSLTARPEEDQPFLPPLRVVLDATLSSLAHTRVQEGEAPTLYLHGPMPTRIADHDNVRYQEVPLAGGRLDLRAVLATLAQHRICEIQIEAGATLSGELVAAGLVDELLLYVAPTLLGDSARPLLSHLNIAALTEQQHLRVVDERRIGQDLRLLLRPAG